MPWEFSALSIPILALMIPLVAILVRHQQKMAEIIHSGSGSNTAAQVEALRQEVAQLKQLVHQQMIALDSATSGKGLSRSSSEFDLGARSTGAGDPQANRPS